MLDVLIGLSKAFDIVHYNIFLRLCGIKNIAVICLPATFQIENNLHKQDV